MKRITVSPWPQSHAPFAPAPQVAKGAFVFLDRSAVRQAKEDQKKLREQQVAMGKRARRLGVTRCAQVGGEN